MIGSSSFTTDCLDGLVQLVEETRPVSSIKGWRSACDLAQLAQPGKKVASGQRRADVFICERLSRRPDRVRAFFNASGCKGDVRCDHDIIWRYVLNDPVIGCVQALVNDLQGQPRGLGDSHP